MNEVDRALRTLQLGVCGSAAGIAFSIPSLHMLVVLVVLLAASLTAVSSTASQARLKINK